MRQRRKIEEFLHGLEGLEYTASTANVYFKIREFMGGLLRCRCVYHEDVEGEPKDYFRLDFFFTDDETGSEIIIYVEGTKVNLGMERVDECTLALYHMARKRK